MKSKTKVARTALITGASSGIGRELARIHAERGGDLVLVARREARLTELASELRARHGVEVLTIVADLASEDGCDVVSDAVAGARLEIDDLVNNAGVGGHGPFAEASPDELERILRVNIAAATRFTRRFVPGMVARGRGRVLNVASMAAFVPGPSSAVYHASKAYVLSLSEALAHELRGSGVTVTAVCPGATATEFAMIAGLSNTRAFARPAPVESVARYAYEAMQKGATIAVPRLADRVSSVMTRLLPRRVVTFATGLALRAQS